jgi:hypothetical protein
MHAGTRLKRDRTVNIGVLIGEDSASQEANTLWIQNCTAQKRNRVSADVNTRTGLQSTISFDADLSVCVYSRFN